MNEDFVLSSIISWPKQHCPFTGTDTSAHAESILVRFLPVARWPGQSRDFRLNSKLRPQVMVPRAFYLTTILYWLVKCTMISFGFQHSPDFSLLQLITAYNPPYQWTRATTYIHRRFCSDPTSLSQGCPALTYGMATTLLAFHTEYCPWRSDWLKLLDDWQFGNFCYSIIDTDTIWWCFSAGKRSLQQSIMPKRVSAISTEHAQYYCSQNSVVWPYLLTLLLKKWAIL